MLRILLSAALAIPASAAVAGDVPVLPVTSPWVKTPITFEAAETDFLGPIPSTGGGGVGPRVLPQDATMPLPAARARAKGAGVAALEAGLTARERALLAARIEAELARRTR
jgi:hypothetical protein